MHCSEGRQTSDNHEQRCAEEKQQGNHTEERHRAINLCIQESSGTTEDAVKGDKQSNGMIENAVMLLRCMIRTL